MEIVLASGNRGKLVELRELLEPLGHTLIPQTDLDVPSPEETGTTFVENAIIKARNAAEITGLPAIADDSGIAAAALGGAPGVYSARFAGPDATDADNNERIVREVNAAGTTRRVTYHCVLVCMRSALDPAPLISSGEWTGALLRRARGTGGFGYDPWFYDSRFGMSSAEMSAELKNQLSHRGLASRALIELLRADPDF